MKLSPVTIHIQNFQSIDDLELEVRGFTCITGPSNIGKSAIVRATSSAILNHPVGGMVRKGAQFCSVEINSDGWGFKWEKNDKGVNRVWLPGKPNALDKIGQTQVPAIKEMGFTSIEVGEDEIQPWLAPQWHNKGCGPLFLLDQSGTRVTDFLSEVSRLTVLQDAIVLAARGKRSNTDQIKTKHEEAEGIRAKLAKIQGVDTLEKVSQELEEQAKSIEEYEEKIAIGEALVLKRQEAEKVIEILEPVEGLKIPKDACGDPIKKLRSIHLFCFQLESSANRVRAIREVTKVKIPEEITEEFDNLREIQKFAQIGPLTESVKLLENLSKVKLPEVKKLKTEVEHLGELAKYATRIGALRASVTLLDKQIDLPDELDEVEKLQEIARFAGQTQELSGEIAALELQLKSTTRDLGEVESEIAAIPACPTCHRPLSPSHTGKHRRVPANP